MDLRNRYAGCNASRKGLLKISRNKARLFPLICVLLLRWVEVAHRRRIASEIGTPCSAACTKSVDGPK